MPGAPEVRRLSDARSARAHAAWRVLEGRLPVLLAECDPGQTLCGIVLLAAVRRPDAPSRGPSGSPVCVHAAGVFADGIGKRGVGSLLPVLAEEMDRAAVRWIGIGRRRVRRRRREVS